MVWLPLLLFLCRRYCGCDVDAVGVVSVVIGPGVVGVLIVLLLCVWLQCVPML